VDGLHLVPVARGVSDFEARILTAQLGAEGIIWELRGADAVYPLGNVDVLVPMAELDEARTVLLPTDAHVDHAPSIGAVDGDVEGFGVEGFGAEGFGTEPWAAYRRRWWFVAVVLAAVATFGVVRMVTLGVNPRPSAPTTDGCGAQPEAVAGGLTAACHG
jgi:hypothetical protein